MLNHDWFFGKLILCRSRAPHREVTTLNQLSKRKKSKDEAWKFGCNRGI